MSPVSSRGLCWLLVTAALSGTALACAERDAPRPDTTDRQLDDDHASVATKSIAPAGAAGGPSAAHVDAGVATAPDAGRPAAELHLDGADVEYEAGRREKPASRKARPIELVLRSTPPGAIAAVDGAAVGPTPAVWQGSTDGRPREFTFVLPGYAIARYRFIPMQSGVVHGTLGRLKADPDAGPVLQDGR